MNEDMQNAVELQQEDNTNHFVALWCAAAVIRRATVRVGG